MRRWSEWGGLGFGSVGVLSLGLDTDWTGFRCCGKVHFVTLVLVLASLGSMEGERSSGTW